MTPKFYASLRLIILRDIATLKANRRLAYQDGNGTVHRFAIRHRQRDLARLRAMRYGTADTL